MVVGKIYLYNITKKKSQYFVIHNLSTDANKSETDFQRSLTVSDRGEERLAGVKLKKGRLVTGKNETLRCLFF